jgi:hypothetical protein
MKDVVQQIQITVVPPAVVDVVWPDAKEMLLRAVEATRGVYDIDSVERGLCEYPNGRGLALDWIGGERMREWLPMAQTVMERYARDNGCTHLEGYGREAWGRWLQKYGWKPAYIAYRMELTDG